MDNTTLTKDFARRSHARITEARAALAKLQAFSKETIKQLARLDKQQSADVDRLHTRLGEIADDVVNKLPEEAAPSDMTRAIAIQTQINDLAYEIEEISLAGGAVEDLSNAIGESISEIYPSLKDAEVQITKVDRLATKIGL